jgi:hypothetical protein
MKSGTKKAAASKPSPKTAARKGNA